MTKERKEQVQYLLAQYVDGLANPAEELLLFKILAEEKDNEEWEQILEEMMAVENESVTYDSQQWEPVIASILNNSRNENETKGRVRSFRSVYRYAAALIVLLGLAITGYIYFSPQDKVALAETHVTNDVEPGGNRATLTLADGSAIMLDSAANGTLSQQGKTLILKLDDGRLAYNPAAGGSEVMYNTISTPRGGQYQVILPDGSKVWLNAASSLRFPTSFSGKERKVELTGEGYFEIAKDANKPFHVQVGEMKVEVLGTHFNLNAYTEDGQVKTTLLEGSVKVEASATSSAILKPGQQAKRINNQTALTITEVNVDHEVAWKNGLFDFDNDSIEDIMRQLGRWYDVEVTYAGSKPQEHYTGSIRREVNISKVLQMLDLAGGAEFSIEGKSIVVKGK